VSGSWFYDNKIMRKRRTYYFCDILSPGFYLKETQMELGNNVVVVMVLYRVICVLSGVLITYWGYTLLRVGIYGEGADLEVAWKDLRLVMKKAIPGVLFAALGAFIIISSIFRGFEITINPIVSNVSGQQSPFVMIAGSRQVSPDEIKAIIESMEPEEERE